MSLDSEKNNVAILAAFEDVLSDKTDTDWLLLGYEGMTNTLKVVETGDGGLEEMADDLNASKIMYAVVKVSDPKTSRNKIILINWQGEGSQNLRKGVCARHLADVKSLLKGVHMTLNARNEDEVEPNVVMDAVAKATATEYNFKDRSEMPEKNSPVGTNYKRTNPQREVNSNSRNKFWEQQEAEEKTRKDQEIKQRGEDAKKLEKERMDREEKEAKCREDMTKDRNQRINAAKKAEQCAETTVSKESGQKEWAQEMQDHEHESSERAKRADQMRMQRKKEAENLIGHKTLQSRSLFESCPVSSLPSLTNKAPRKVLKQTFCPNTTDASSSPPKDESCAPKRRVSGRWPPQHDEPEPQPAVTAQVPGKISEWKPKSEPIETEVKTCEPIIEAYVAPPTPVVDPVTTKVNGHSSLPVTDVPEMAQELSPEPQSSPVSSSDLSGKHIICEIDGVDYQILPEHGLCARAVYDYQAADETEITFDPGDIITNIDQIDIGWWQGIGPAATFGLFPANYVDLITPPT